MVYQSIDQSNPLNTNIFSLARRVIFGGIIDALTYLMLHLTALGNPKDAKMLQNYSVF